MSKSKSEKIQIVAFSSNESDYHPIEMLNSFLDMNNHLILKQTSVAKAFTMTLPKSTKQTKIMICSVLKLDKEYTGIMDVNCYIFFVDLEKEDIAKFEFILNYIKENCDLDKKIFVIGMMKDKQGKKYLEKNQFKQYFEPFNIIYEYKEIVKDKKNVLSDTFMDIFNYCLKNPIKNDYNVDDKDRGQAGSCNIF